MTTLSRRRLLAVGAGASLAVAVGPAASAFAAPAPVEDDLAYLQLLAVGKLIAIVHLEAVREAKPHTDGTGQLVLSNGTTVEVSRRRWRPLLDQLEG